jgi:hypothetical protein
MIAHIYKGRKKTWKLLITTGAAINEGVISETTFESIRDAKLAAKELGATPHNY